LFTNALQGNPKMGTYLGLFNCTICLPQIVAAVLGGTLLGIVGGEQVMMLVMAGVFLVLGSVCVLTIKSDNK
ncbi:MAG: MFS transporter, partial [Prevotella sp.]|nr:MFS transporter [Candidatus Prevotella equi]MDO4993168.1 MFS transporter [Prevotellaceae bacterium]